MHDERWLESLREAARELAITEDVLRRWLDEEIESLGNGARVRDYLMVFAIRRVRSRLAAARSDKRRN
ncbi:DUF3562 domain-containing protein [Burkholderia ubonensis]|uniref:DUF3562 domain-containing protein n=1 Tax=Burkholderia ubonensis TaxID=101571 RepID=A0AAW3N2S2_9BURK|nr:DUF3562 domain-containing protein [Burkholderia ubonensis]KVT41259.1 hypothetical protein WK53_19535 [Burkholderia ubonensis]